MDYIKKMSEKIADMLVTPNSVSVKNYSLINKVDCYLQASAEQAKKEGVEPLETVEDIRIYLADELGWSQTETKDFITLL